MKIIIDLRVYDWTGLGRVAKGISKYLPEKMKDDTFIYILNPGQGEKIIFNNVIKEYIHYKTFDLREHIEFIKIIKKHKPIDIFHSLHFNHPLILSKKIMLISNIYDLAYEYSEDAFRTIFHKIYYKYFFKKTLQKSDIILSQSKFTQSDLIKYFNQKSIVIYPGFEDQEWGSGNMKNARTDSFQQFKPYILFVGINHPRKNLKMLVEVFSQLINDKRININLLIAGSYNDKRYDIKKHINDNKMSKNIKLLGFVSDYELMELYNNALLYVIPSFIESGFSYPALEAASYGVPILANKYDMKEFGNDSILYADMRDKIDFELMLEKIVNDEKLRKVYSIKAIKWSKSFPWEIYIEKLVKLYRKKSESK